MNRALRFVIAASLGTLAFAAMTAVAWAHADLLSSDPAGGSTVQTAPAQLTLNYSEEPDPQLSQVVLLNSSGATVATGQPTLQGQKTLVVPITGDMPDGVYTVSWSAVSVDDGHTTTDSFSFGVGVKAVTGAAAPPASASGPTVLGVAGKALLYSGLMLVVAVAVIGEGVFGGAPKARPRIAAGAGLAAVGGSIALLVSQQQATHASMSRFLHSRVARTPIALVVLCLAAAVFAFIAARRPASWLPWAAGIAAAIAMALRAHGGHATATSTPVLSQAEQWVHMIAGACWAGGLVLLILLIRERRDDPPVSLARRYSTVALAAIAVVVATGLLRSVSELGGIDQLVHIWDSSYGRTLAIKIAVVLVVIALGAINRYRSVGRLATDASPLRRIASTEVVAVVGILLLTATLTSYAPPTTPVGAGGGDGAGSSDVVAIGGSDLATTMTVALTVTPAQPGPNLYRANVTAYGTDTPVQADALTLQLNSVSQPNLPGAQVKCKPDPNGGWVAQSLDPSTPGTFALQAQVRSGASVTVVPLTLVTRSAGAITTGASPDGSTVANASFGDGVRLQGTSSPGTPTQIHLTAFAANQTELPLSGLNLVASPATGAPIHLKVQRFSAGHFAASPTLDAGTWTIDAVATTRDGQAYQVTWQTTVTG